MPRSILIASGKGGVGKTVVSVNLATCLAMRNKKVTIIDADIEMANVALRLKLDKKEKAKTLHDVLAGEARLEDAIYSGPYGLKVIPSGISFESLKKVDESRLESVLREALKDTDILIIDAPAGLKTALPAMRVAEELLIVTNPEVASIADAMKVRLAFKEIGGSILGIVVNRMSYSPEDLKIDEIETLLGEKVISVIPEDENMKKAVAYASPIILKYPYSPSAKAFKRLSDYIIGKEEKKTDIIRRFLKGLFGR